MGEKRKWMGFICEASSKINPHPPKGELEVADKQ